VLGPYRWVPCDGHVEWVMTAEGGALSLPLVALREMALDRSQPFMPRVYKFVMRSMSITPERIASVETISSHC